MAISEQKLRELAELEPPRFLERIADFLADLTLRSSSVAVLERAQAAGAEPIGASGRAAEAFGVQLSQRAAFAGTSDPLGMIYRLLKPYQIGPVELRQFAMWLVKFHDKYAETEVLREPPGAAQAGTPAQAAARTTATSDAAAQSAARQVALSGVGIEQEELLPGRRRVRVVRRPAEGTTEVTVSEPSRTPRPVHPERPVPPEPAVDGRPLEPRREPDVLSRAWRAGHRSEAPATPPPELELAPPAARRTAARALWMSNLVMASTATGMILGRSLAPAAFAGRLAAPGTLGVAGPSMLGTPMEPPSFAFPLSHPPVSVASWLGAAPPAPYPADFVRMPGAPLPVGQFALPQPVYEPATAQLREPVVSQLPIAPGRSALEASEILRSLIGAPPDVSAAEQQAPRRGTRGMETAPGAEGTRGLEAAPGDVGSQPEATLYPRPAPRRAASPIPGLLAAGLVGYLIGRLVAGSAPRGISSTPSVDLFVQPIPSAEGPPRARIFSRSWPGFVEATVVDAWGRVPTPTMAIPRGTRGGAVPASGAMPSLNEILGYPTGAGLPTPRTAMPPIRMHPQLGEVTLVAPPLAVASEQAERRGSAVAFDWKTLARATGQLDRSAWARLSQVLPPGTQAIYPAIPTQELPSGAVNLRLAPSVLRPLLTQAYGSQAAGIAGTAAAMAVASSGVPLAGAPLPARILPVKRPIGSEESVLPSPAPSAGGALQEAGAGQARRTPMLDFLGVPVRLAPSLAGRAELRDELAARGIAAQGAQPQIVRPHVFTPLREHVFPGMQTVQAEPDRAAWRKAAPHFGLRDAEPTTVLAPDARVRPITPAAPLPQLRTGAPQPALRPWLAQSISDRSAGFRPATPAPLVSAVRPSAWEMPEPRTETAGRPTAPAAREHDIPTVPSHMEPPGIPSPAWTEAGRPEPPQHRAPMLEHRLAMPHAAPPGQRMETPSLELPAHLSPEHLQTTPPGAMHRWATLGAARYAEHPQPLAAGTLLQPPQAPTLSLPRVAGSVPSLGAAVGRVHVPSSEPGIHGVGPVLDRLARPRFASLLPSPVPRTAVPGLVPTAVVSPSLAGARPMAALTPFAVPTLVPLPVPILGRVASHTPWQGRAATGGVGTPVHEGATPPAVGLSLDVHLPVPEPSIGPSTLIPSAGAVPRLQAWPVASPSSPGGPEVPMTLPRSAIPEDVAPTRAVSRIVERAPTRYYASVDAGPARRGVTVQRATSEAAGTVGGPHHPLPTAHRARQFPADQQRASVLTSREEGMTANEVYLLANDVWSILKQRLKWEADRRGRW